MVRQDLLEETAEIDGAGVDLIGGGERRRPPASTASRRTASLPAVAATIRGRKKHG